MYRTRSMAAAALAALLSIAGCSDDETGPTPQPVIGVTVTALSSTSVRISFNSRAGDDRYRIERAEGATGTFAAAGTVDAPATAGAVTFTDNTLKVATLYRYRVFTVIGSSESVASSEANTTTLGLGNAAADITADITTSRTLFADTVYTLKGFVHVLNGATLTIQPGTKIVGDFNTLGSSLFILRGAKIQAVGTAALPIVFTSSQPAGSRKPGDWGGLVIVGNAPINRSGTVNVEGTTAASGINNYPVPFSGGTVAADNSGTLAYVRIEFAGWDPSGGSNQEINSFTFAAVGSGTRGSFLQAVAGLDDAFEWFGGSGDWDHLVSYEAVDDIFDMSTGFTGRIQFAIGFNSTQLTAVTGRGVPASDPQGIENDGCDASAAGCDNGFNSLPLTVPVVANFTLIGTGDVATSNANGGHGMVLRRGTGGFYVNGVVARWPRSGTSVRDAETFTRAGGTNIPNLATADLAVKNVVYAENAVIFQTGQAGDFDLVGNSLTSATGNAASLFTLLPATGATPSSVTAFDWTPPATSPAATGGLTAFTGKLQAAAGSFVTGTAYRGAADPNGPKWWQGWTAYYRN